MNFILRDFQKESLKWLNKNCHVITVAPTGSGKSLIFERFVQNQNVRALLISPLVALARQHYHALSRLKVDVRLGTTPVKDLPPPRAGVWIVAPERLFPKEQRKSYQALASWRPNFLIVDECHCISEWGDDFRDAFAQVPSLIGAFKIPRSLWLTATLPPSARLDLKTELGHEVVEIGSYEFPPTIDLTVKELSWSERLPSLMGWLKRQQSPGIIFVGSRRFCHRLARLVAASGRGVHIYHAGLSSEERCAIEAQIESKTDVIIATSAFGMGMDYKALKWCVVWQLPPSILSLTQQIGRVGRNRSKGEVCIFWSEEDFRLLHWTSLKNQKRKEALTDLHQLFKDPQNIKLGLNHYFNDSELVDPCK